MGVAYSEVGTTTVVVLGDSPPDEDAWHALVEWLRTRAAVGDLQLLVVSHGAAPPAGQRQELVERVLRPHFVRAAVVTESRVVRGAAAAMSWFLPYPIECFLPGEAERACKYLAVSDLAALQDAVAEHEASLGLVRRLLEETPSRSTPARFRPES